MDSPEEACAVPIYRHKNLQIILIVSLMAPLGYTIINPAFPAIVDSLKISAQDVGLLITVYSVPGLLFVPILGILADRFGRKRIMVPSLFLFGIAGGACAFAHDFRILLALRFFQGVGGASLFPLCLTLIGDFYSDRDCTRAMGYNFGVTWFANAAYPFIGGAVAMLAWYYPFFFYLLAIPVGLLVLLKLENPELRKKQDIRGYLSSVLGTMKNRQIAGIFTCSLATFTIYSGAYLAYFSLMIGKSFGVNSLVIGLIVSAGFVSAAITSSQTSKLSRLSSERNLIKAAFVLIALALVAVPFASDLWLVTIPAIVFGAGIGIIDPVKISILSSLAPTKYRAAFMSLDETFIILGMSAGPVIMGAVFAAWGFNGVFNAGAALSIVAFAVMVLMFRQKQI